eukprot:SAG31_NODE_697_length_12745_cov_67.888502_4_plen_139_part_00
MDVESGQPATTVGASSGTSSPEEVAPEPEPELASEPATAVPQQDRKDTKEQVLEGMEQLLFLQDAPLPAPAVRVQDLQDGSIPTPLLLWPTSKRTTKFRVAYKSRDWCAVRLSRQLCPSARAHKSVITRIIGRLIKQL